MVRSLVRAVGVSVATATLALVAVTPIEAQQAQSLGTVNVSRRVMANGETLAPGTYTLRVLPDTLSKSAVGQTPAESRWVEFVRGGKVVAKEVATVMTGAEARAVAKGPGPASGSSKTELLKGNDYLRIWVNRGGTHYLVHLTVAKMIP
jgi:hypothetical protein